MIPTDVFVGAIFGDFFQVSNGDVLIFAAKLGCPTDKICIRGRKMNQIWYKHVYEVDMLFLAYVKVNPGLVMLQENKHFDLLTWQMKLQNILLACNITMLL